ncbi:MAG: hypothetical protein ACF8GE_10525 [Phycisphaerales bacterium JB043]
MPRLRAIRLGVLGSLAEQLRFTPMETVRRQLLRAQSLAMSLDDAQTYPEGWIVRQITGFVGEGDLDTLVLGDALRRELSAFIERMSDTCALPIERAPQGAMRIEHLAERWSVSHATIGRYRQRGLIAWRVRTESGHPVLVFPLECVEWFEGVNRDLVSRASEFTRIEAPQRDRLARLAHRAARRFGWNLSQTASRLGARTGRAHESMRLLLLEHEECGFEGRQRVSRRARKDIEYHTQEGRSSGDVARSLEINPQRVRRIALAQRASFLHALVLPEAGGVPTPPGEDLLGRLRHVSMATTLRWWIDSSRDDHPVDVDLEVEASLATHAHLSSASALRAVLDPVRLRATSIDTIETHLRRASQLVERLVGMHRRTMLTAIESRLRVSLDTLGPTDARRVYDDAHEAACDAIIRHDPSTTARVAGVISIGVDRRVNDLLQRALIHPPVVESPAQTSARAQASVTLEPWTPRSAPWAERLLLRDDARDAIDSLPEHLRQIVTMRFGGSLAWASTLGEIALARSTTIMTVARQLRDATRRLHARETEAPSGR